MTGEQQNLRPTRPTHRAFLVKKTGDKSFGMRIGAAWLHRDGKGFSLDLEALPAKGQRIELRLIDWNKSKDGAVVPQDGEEVEEAEDGY